MSRLVEGLLASQEGLLSVKLFIVLVLIQLIHLFQRSIPATKIGGTQWLCRQGTCDL